MEYKKNKVNGYREGYNYPIGHYKLDLYSEDKKRKFVKGNLKKNMKDDIKGSFWTPCDEKAKGRQRSGRQSRHSFCDGE